MRTQADLFKRYPSIEGYPRDTWTKVYSDNSHFLICFKPIIPSFRQISTFTFLSIDEQRPFIIWFKSTGAMLWGIKGAKAFRSLKAHYPCLFWLLWFSLKAPSVCLVGLPPSHWLIFAHSLSTLHKKERGKAMTDLCNKEQLMLLTRGKWKWKQEVRFQVIEHPGQHEKDVGLLHKMKLQKSNQRFQGSCRNNLSVHEFVYGHFCNYCQNSD